MARTKQRLCLLLFCWLIFSSEVDDTGNLPSYHTGYLKHTGRMTIKVVCGGTQLGVLLVCGGGLGVILCLHGRKQDSSISQFGI